VKLIYSYLYHLLAEVRLKLREPPLECSTSLKQRYATNALASLPDAIVSPTQRSLPS
jgi:hypothetical protein